MRPDAMGQIRVVRGGGGGVAHGGNIRTIRGGGHTRVKFIDGSVGFPWWTGYPWYGLGYGYPSPYAYAQTTDGTAQIRRAYLAWKDAEASRATTGTPSEERVQELKDRFLALLSGTRRRAVAYPTAAPYGYGYGYAPWGYTW